MPEPTVVSASAPTLSADPSIADLRAYLAADSEPAAASAAAPAETETTEISETPVAAADDKTVSGQPETPAASEPAKEATEPEKDKDNKPGESAIDKRFRKLAQQRDEARQKAERLERELAAKTSQPGPAATAATEPAKTAAATDKPVPPDPAKWTGTWEELEAAKLDYVEKLTDWKADQRERAKQAEAQQQQAQELHKTWESKSEAFAKDNPEFEDAVANIGPMATRAGVADLIKESPVGPEMVLYLHQHPEEVARMGACKTQVALARELGKLEAQLSAPVSQTTTPASKKALPKPPASLGGGQPAAVDLNTADMRTFKREVIKLLAD